MKATIDLDEALYRRLKIEAARRGRTIRELVAEGIRAVVDSPPPPSAPGADEAADGWFGSLKAYSGNAIAHDLRAMRESVARGRGASGK